MTECRSHGAAFYIEDDVKHLDNPYFSSYIRNITDDGYYMGKSLFSEQFRFSMSNLLFRNIFTFENEKRKNNKSKDTIVWNRHFCYHKNKDSFPYSLTEGTMNG